MLAAPRSLAFKVTCLHCDQSSLEYCSKVSRTHNESCNIDSDQQQKAAGLVAQQAGLHKHRPEVQHESAQAQEHHQAALEAALALINTVTISIRR
jgi:hypothetical protein